MSKPLEDIVDRGQWLQFDIGFNLAQSRESQSFRHIAASAYK